MLSIVLIVMYFIKRFFFIDSAYKFVRMYSSGRRTHYEVLNLQKTCTDKDIKDAFIQLSKEYHPDKNKNEKAQENFVRIVEAYNVLGKPSSRAQYDQNSDVDHQNGYSYVYKTHTPYNWRTNNNYSQSYSQSYNEKTDTYYGVKGLKKLSNTDIILICFGVAIVGIILQVVVIRESYNINRKKVQEKSIKLAEELEKVKAARGKTRDIQTQALLDKIVSAANPSVATASLGKTLADDKK